MSGGAYILARAGLLERRRCTIHWEHIPALIEEFPDLRLERTLYVFDGDRITCAGGLAAFDMMAALIARRHGDDLAMAVSEWYLRTQSRSGEDSQRVSLRERYRVANERVLRVLALMEERIETPLSREALAARRGGHAAPVGAAVRQPSARNPVAALSRLAAGAGAEIAAPDQPAGGGGGHRLRFCGQRPFFPRLPATFRASAQPGAGFGKSRLIFG